MSPLWRDEIGLYVAPRRIALSRMKRGLRPTCAAEQNIVVETRDTTQWEGALESLKTCLEDAAWRDAKVRLIISDHWARYAIVPWSDALSDQAERIQHARYCMATTYGDVVSQWTVTLSDGAPGLQQVACAIPTELLGRIEALCEPHGLQVQSVQPQLIAAFNAWRRKLPHGGAWFVTLDEGSLAAAHFTPANWDCVRSARIGNDWEIELKRLKTFGRLARTQAEDGRVYVDAPQWLREKALDADDAIVWLEDGADSKATPERFALLQRMYA